MTYDHIKYLIITNRSGIILEYLVQEYLYYTKYNYFLFYHSFFILTRSVITDCMIYSYYEIYSYWKYHYRQILKIYQVEMNHRLMIAKNFKYSTWDNILQRSKIIYKIWSCQLYASGSLNLDLVSSMGLYLSPIRIWYRNLNSFLMLSCINQLLPKFIKFDYFTWTISVVNIKETEILLNNRYFNFM